MSDFVSVKKSTFFPHCFIRFFKGLGNTFSIKVNRKAELMRLCVGFSLLSSLERRAVLPIPVSPAEEVNCCSGYSGRRKLAGDGSSLPRSMKSHDGTCFSCPLEAGGEWLLFSCSSITSHNYFCPGLLTLCCIRSKQRV